MTRPARATHDGTPGSPTRTTPTPTVMNPPRTSIRSPMRSATNPAKNRPAVIPRTKRDANAAAVAPSVPRTDTRYDAAHSIEVLSTAQYEKKAPRTAGTPGVAKAARVGTWSNSFAEPPPLIFRVLFHNGRLTVTIAVSMACRVPTVR